MARLDCPNMDNPSPHEDHRRMAESGTNRQPISCAVLTVSDTRTSETDEGGPLVAGHLEQAGHVVSDRVIVKDDPGMIRKQLDAWLAYADLPVIITTGGTGVSRRDTTVEVVRPLITYELPGFGELFRLLSYEQVSAAAMLSRAMAGIIVPGDDPESDTFIFCLPGSMNAIETAMTQLIIPQLPHLVWERRK
jgi:molybdenum cofactor biosynthesis protein B